MRILIDENLPRYLKRVLSKYDVQTVQDMGWHGVKNGTLLNLAESVFDIFLRPIKICLTNKIYRTDNLVLSYFRQIS